MLNLPIQVAEESTFQQLVLESNRPMLVIFCGDDCRPCREFIPAVKGIKEVYQERIDTVRVKSSQNPVLVAEYEVVDMPKFVLFDNGKAVSEITGVVSVFELLAWVDEFFATKSSV